MLRDYQQQVVDAARELLYKQRKRSAVIQLPTGAGKTAVLSEIFASVYGNKKRGWFVVPRNELVRQASAHLVKWRVPHGIIDASHTESRACYIHVASKDTILRRLDKIKNLPDLVVFDEAHVALDGQAKIMKAAAANPRIKFLGLTATPEREDGRGLSELYEGIVYGASIPYLTEAGYLAPLRYFAPPVEGIEAARFKGGEADEAELDAILTERAVYGKAVEYYKEYGRKADGSYMRALGFCRGVKAAEKQAAEFRAAGFRCEAVSGYMPKVRQRALIDGFNGGGGVQILVNADLLTYGFDSPGIEYGFSLRRTASRALYFQIVGRLLRTAPGKTEALFFDHANAINLHQDPRYPGVPLFYIPDLAWNFNGKEKRKVSRKEKPPLRLCPYNAFEICLKPSPCRECERYTPKQNETPVVENVPLSERGRPGDQYVITAAERRELQDEVLQHAEAARRAEDDESLDAAVREMIGIAKSMGYAPMWAYHRVNAQKHVADVRILWSICRVMGYKPGWVHFKKKELAEGREMLKAAEGAV
jgi:superfamily II DNA or RNA helicase